MFQQYLAKSKSNVAVNQQEFLDLLGACYQQTHSKLCVEWYAVSVCAYINRSNQQKKSLADYNPLKLNQCPKLKSDSTIDLAQAKSNMDKLAVIKLNGGLGTSMGCEGPKSLINVTNDNSFLDIILQQKESLKAKFKLDVPFYLMNSFNTQQAMQPFANKVSMFVQNKVPRFMANAIKLAALSDEFLWAPPGHGDLYRCLYEQGILDQLLAQKKEYIFVSNADNLGATVDDAILDYVITNNIDFLMEITPKTVADVKGGAIVKQNERYKLLERAQIDAKDNTLFEDISTFSYFNTNNLWINIAAIKTYIEENKLQLPVIFNQKNVQGNTVIQCETAMGSAIEVFAQSSCLHVDRSRFFPVKKTVDLFLLRSDLIKKQADGSVVNVNNQPLPIINLSDDYTTITDFEQLVKYIPDISKLNSLTVEGKVEFGQHISLVGDVTIINKSDDIKKIEYTKLTNQTLTL